MLKVVKGLKDEIRRLARKEARAQMAPTKRAAVQHRREIAQLKRQLAAMQRRIARLETPGRAASGAASGSDQPRSRFSARSVRSQRRRLRLSAAEYGRLIGVSGQTI